MGNLENGLYEMLLSVNQKKELDSPEYSSNHDAKKLKDVDFASSEDILSNYIRDIVRSRLKEITGKTESDVVKSQIAECNDIIKNIIKNSENKDADNLMIPDEDNFLLSIWDGPVEPKRPYSSLSVSSIFTGGSSVVALYEELKKEIESSDEVYFLVSHNGRKTPNSSKSFKYKEGRAF